MAETRQEPSVEKDVDKAVHLSGDLSVEKAVETVDNAEALRKRKRRRIRALRSFLFRLAALALVVYILLFHIVGVAIMPSGDMSPRLDAGDMLLYYRIDRDPKAQDIVVIEKADSGQTFVLRVVAKEGDTVEVTEEKGLCVNGNTLIENNIFHLTMPYEGRVEYPVTMKAGEYFVMADLRNGGMDSRFFGPVTREEIKGIVITLLRRNNL